MEVELTDHLGYEPHQEPPGGVGNTRNGTSPKALVTERGPVRIKAPRRGDSSFGLGFVRNGQRRFRGFDDKILGRQFLALQVLSKLKQRGVRDTLIWCVDGLKGFPEVIVAIFPQTTLQTSVVHLIRQSLMYIAANTTRSSRTCARSTPRSTPAPRRQRSRPSAESGSAAASNHPGLARELGARDPIFWHLRPRYARDLQDG
ncbi:MAG: transposase [Solirubrobacteraceae bacterium]